MATILNAKGTVPLKNETKAALGTDESRQTIDMIKACTAKIKARTAEGGILAAGVADAYEELLDAIRELEASSKGRRAISLNKNDYQTVDTDPTNNRTFPIQTVARVQIR